MRLCRQFLLFLCTVFSFLSEKNAWTIPVIFPAGIAFGNWCIHCRSDSFSQKIICAITKNMTRKYRNNANDSSEADRSKRLKDALRSNLKRRKANQDINHHEQGNLRRNAPLSPQNLTRDKPGKKTG
jgi:hypothetical protein